MMKFLLLALFALVLVNAEVILDVDGNPIVDIVGGNTASTGAYPFIASLRYGSQRSHICGGTIISSTHIVTAAHCTEGSSASQFYIGVGNNAINSQQVYPVAQIIEHPSWNSNTMENDIAIMVLRSPLTFSSKVVESLAYATVGTIANNAVVNVAGWGTTRSGGTVVAQLREVDVNVVSPAQCRSDYGASMIHDSNICAAAPGKDSCQGDSGGPLISTGANVQLVGVVSWGYGCAEADYPGVYTRVGDYADWISATVKLN